MKQDVYDANTLLSQFVLQPAKPEYTHDICNLVNLTYRGDTGWTRETHLIGGDRTNLTDITTAITKSEAQFYVVYLHKMLAACIYLAQEKDHAYIGFFSVHPDFQGQGVGKYILQQAETIAKKQLAANKIRMFAVSQRTELIAFYQRRGYRRIGNKATYPLQLKIGIPKVAHLTIEFLEKSI